MDRSNGRQRNETVTRGRRRKWEKEGRKDGRREEENQRRIGNGGNGKKKEDDWVRKYIGQTIIKQIEEETLT